MTFDRLSVHGYTLNGYSSLIPGRRTLVFVHGIGVAGNYFFPLAEQLEDNYNIIIFDFPGYGKTPKPAHALTIEDHVVVLRGILEHFGLKDPILVGHSMGCQVIANMLSDDPTYSGAAVLISPSTNKNERTRTMQAIRLFQDIFHETFKMNSVTFIDYLRMGILRFLRTTKFMVTDHIEDHLSHVRAPVLYIRGGRDLIAPQAWLDYLVKMTPQANLIVHDGAPHNLHYVIPRQVANDIRKFIG